MAVLNKAWGSITQMPEVEAAVVTGEDAEGEGAVAPKLLDKPMMIYVTDGAVDGFDKVEKVVLMDDKVCIGMWAFNCVKMSPEDAKKDARLAETGDDVPRFVFISRDLEDVDTVDEKKMSAKNVFKAMTKHAKKAYATKFEKNVKQMLEVLGEFDKISNAEKVLSAAEAREEDPSATDKKKFAKEREELAERLKEAEAARDELRNFELKPIKV